MPQPVIRTGAVTTRGATIVTPWFPARGWHCALVRWPDGSETVEPHGDLAFPREPAAPVSLATFLVRAGGIQDYRGELRALDAHKRIGLVRRDGLKLDRAREIAEEAGYLRPGSTINDLLDVLADDLRGRPHYCPEYVACQDIPW